MCEVLEEMRVCNKTRNYSYLLGLIEEVQTMGNRMEAKLEEGKDYSYRRKQLKKISGILADDDLAPSVKLDKIDDALNG